MHAASTFPASTASVPAARRFVRATLEAAGCLAAWDAAQVLVSELATNAVLHARTSFTVEVERTAAAVRVSVADRSPVLPTPRSYGTDSTTGRGMRLVATIALAWGAERTPDGKAVWFDVAAEGDGGLETEPWSDADDVEALLAAFADDDPADGAPRAGLRSTATTLGEAA